MRWPEVPEWVDRRDLGADVLADLRSLSKQGAEFVADHLVAAGALIDEDPRLAWEHARAARSQGGRVAVVRETVGVVAYRAGLWPEAVAELRAARRMSGNPELLAVLADAERALGHPERALELGRSAEAQRLEPAAAAELQIVVAGARSDMGQRDAAISTLRSAVRDVDPDAPFAFRLYYAYAALLEEDDRPAEAVRWFIRAADADGDEETDAVERAEELASNGPRAPVGDPLAPSPSEEQGTAEAQSAFTPPAPSPSEGPGATEAQSAFTPQADQLPADLRAGTWPGSPAGEAPDDEQIR